jgi:predicted dehydrogenase
MAAALDGQIELVCGAFSADPERSALSGSDLFLPPDRCYDRYEQMILRESKLPAGERMDMVSIVTPNHLHFHPASMALDHGFHVICDKPVCLSLDEAKKLQQKVRSSGLIFALTHNYTGYPMVKQARHIVSGGALGKIRRVVIEYAQGWLSDDLESTGHKQASWRTDPALAGIAGAMGDIGTHAENLCGYITGLQIASVCADLHIHISGRRLDDDGNVLLRLANGARGILTASQVAAGEENNLRIKIYGETGGLEWAQMEPNTLTFRWNDKPTQVYRTGGPGLCRQAEINTRLPAGHPEGYLEAFANIYRNVAFCIQATLSGQKVDEVYLDFPTIDDGVRGMAFIEAVVRSGKQGEEKWVSVGDER